MFFKIKYTLKPKIYYFVQACMFIFFQVGYKT